MNIKSNIKSSIIKAGYAHKIIEGVYPVGTTYNELIEYIDKEYNNCFGGSFLKNNEDTGEFKYKLYTD